MNLKLREFPVPNRWCVLAYYSLCPYAPDGSGRIVIAGADLKTQLGEVIILSADGEVLDRFGEAPVTPGFWHTGRWQSWSPDAKYVYYQAGTHQHPEVHRRELSTGETLRMEGDLEGCPPSGEPAISCEHGMLYAAGYGSGIYDESLSPIPFREREKHGLWKMSFDPPSRELVLSTEELLRSHPDVDRLREFDNREDGLTLMTYCVRWSPDGSRFLFYFGNHTVANKVDGRNEPRVGYVFTADRNCGDLHLAMDLSFGRSGVHWSWQADNEHLVGYGPDPADPGRRCLAEVKYDGTGYRKINDHNSGGHPSVCPSDFDVVVTDENSGDGGAVLFFSKRTGEGLGRIALPKFIGEKEPPGRNPLRVCHHPVFNRTGDRLLCNTLPGNGLATLCELRVTR
ncbi:MAG: hypothetical protein PF795_04455 [Kiritimatiellae bacterium]|jgi:hypothetical protein|nr:hypothetical protein [Kiritimatiellia bacterium]